MSQVNPAGNTATFKLNETGNSGQLTFKDAKGQERSIKVGLGIIGTLTMKGEIPQTKSKFLQERAAQMAKQYGVAIQDDKAPSQAKAQPGPTRSMAHEALHSTAPQQPPTAPNRQAMASSTPKATAAAAQQPSGPVRDQNYIKILNDAVTGFSKESNVAKKKEFVNQFLGAASNDFALLSRGNQANMLRFVQNDDKALGTLWGKLSLAQQNAVKAESIQAGADFNLKLDKLPPARA